MSEIAPRTNNSLDIIKLLAGPGNQTTSNSGGVTETVSSNISQEGLSALLSNLLSNPSNGLAAVSAGQRSHGLYNSTTNQLLTNDLITRSAAQVAATNKTETRTTNDTRQTKVSNDGLLGKNGNSKLALGAGILQILPKEVKDKLTESILGSGSASAQGTVGRTAEVPSPIDQSTVNNGGHINGFVDNIATTGPFTSSGLSIGATDFGGFDFDSFDFGIPDASLSDLGGADLSNFDFGFDPEQLFFADGGKVEADKDGKPINRKVTVGDVANSFGGMLEIAIKGLINSRVKRDAEIDKYADGGVVNTGLRNNATSVSGGTTATLDGTEVVLNSLIATANNNFNRAVGVDSGTVPQRSNRRPDQEELSGTDGSGVASDNPNAGQGSSLGKGMSAGEKGVASSIAGQVGNLAGVPGLSTVTGLALAENNNQALGVTGKGLAGIVGGLPGLLAYSLLAKAIGDSGAPSEDAGNYGMSVDPGQSRSTTIGDILGIPSAEMSTATGFGFNIGDSLGNSGALGNSGPSGDTSGIGSSSDNAFSDGGKIRGKGDGVSDSIPAKIKETGKPIKVSNGEYIIPADVTSILGEDFLNQLVASLHTPAAVQRARA
jgi:hypothetical protein